MKKKAKYRVEEKIADLADIEKMKKGDVLVYHIGMLCNDRAYVESLDFLADYLYKQSSAAYSFNKLELKQKKIAPYCYKYLVKKI